LFLLGHRGGLCLIVHGYLLHEKCESERLDA